MELIQFKDEEQLSIDASFAVADFIYAESFELFKIVQQDVPNAQASFTAYSLCMRFAESLMLCSGWTPEELARDIRHLAQEQQEQP